MDAFDLDGADGKRGEVVCITDDQISRGMGVMSSYGRATNEMLGYWWGWSSKEIW